MNSNSSNPEIECKLRRIERISDFARVICGILIVPAGLLALVVAGSVFLSIDANLTYSDQSVAVADLSAAGRVMVAVLALASGTVQIKALIHLRGLLGNYARREIFTADSARQLRNFGVSCMMWALLKLGWGFLPLFAFTHREQPVQLSGDTFVIGFIIVLLSWFAEMAATLREENDLTI